MYSTTGAIAAVTANIAMYFTTEAGAAVTARAGTASWSSRVPGPTVNRRVSVNSGAARMGATTLCLDMRVLTVRETPRN